MRFLCRNREFCLTFPSAVHWCFFFASVVVAIYTSVVNVGFGSFCAQARVTCRSAAFGKSGPARHWLEGWLKRNHELTVLGWYIG